jgi:hypothetical protein
MINVPLFRAVPLGVNPTKTISVGSVTMFELPSPIPHSPKPIVLLVPSRTLRIPIVWPSTPM